MQIMSNGQYKSIEHRAVVDPYKERLSIAAFNHPKWDAKIAPLPDLLKANEEAQYKTILLEEFLRQKLGSRLEGKNLVNKMKN